MTASKNNPPRDDRPPEVVIDGLLSDAISAKKRISDCDQSQVDTLVEEIGWAIYQDHHARDIARTTYEETGFGNVADKYKKLRYGSRCILADLLGKPSVGVRESDRPGVIEIAKPVGVIGAFVPSTNPGPTIMNVVMLAVKGRNAVIISVSPHCIQSAYCTIEYIRDQLDKVGAPRDLVTFVPRPANRDRANELMQRADMVQVTGSSSNVEAGQQSGTPNYCVGQGNLVVIVDETANLKRAGRQIATGTAFDYGTPCVSESVLVAHTDIYSPLLNLLKAENGYHCSVDETTAIEQTLFPDGSLDRSVIARPPSVIADHAAIDIPDTTEFLIVEQTEIGKNYPLSGEKIAPIITVYQANTFQKALKITKEILDYEGTGHSCTVHTRSHERAFAMGHEINVCRIGVNQQGFAVGMSADNGLTDAYSLGAGTWGGNQLDRNLSFEDFLCTTQVTYPLDDSDLDSEN
ncbi:aldehyde dehydrogenase family protein [Halocatena halophila]|uniref:aldehyde dehydrogenase family protein n=1 Tax=Halocatena halophila TaxID=2814576 RepID=UPI002ECFE3DE